jgi:hypothetical protein
VNEGNKTINIMKKIYEEMETGLTDKLQSSEKRKKKPPKQNKATKFNITKAQFNQCYLRKKKKKKKRIMLYNHTYKSTKKRNNNKKKKQRKQTRR